MSSTFASFSVANYRYYFIGGFISNIGSWLGRTAISWLVLVELTKGSASSLGLVTAVLFLPSMILAPNAGALADRYEKRVILRTTASIFFLNSLALALLTISGHITLPMVYLCSAIDGLANAFDAPARQSFTSELVESRLLPNAIALNSTSFNAARLIGPGLAGVAIALVGTGWAILIDTMSYLAMIIVLSILDRSAIHLASIRKGRGQILEGLRYTWHRLDLVILLCCGLAVGGFGFNFTISNAVMATEFYGRGPGEYGFLGSLMGLGAVVAALLASRRKRPRLRYALIGMAGYVLFNLAAAFSPTFWLFAVLQIPVGLASITALVTANTMLQTSTAPHMRGRVMSLWGLATLGWTPLVSPVVGYLGDVAGPRSTLLFGVICVGIALITMVTAVMRVDRLSIHLDFTRKGWLWLERGEVSENPDSSPR